MIITTFQLFPNLKLQFMPKNIQLQYTKIVLN